MGRGVKKIVFSLGQRGEDRLVGLELSTSRNGSRALI